ncbi:glycoside hydrolase family 16 protein [Dactylosporangium sp. AC04546]|uniref:glycoside hydrolase family 16 protein n=1 Tax=Dactylosporangium sp. AC04546 TaxID=2862460 RepID=UPI001EE1396D|nr:glycoside hydrolase family 16 protein [Dactylosporangium sp. AC04546]WVK84929.1 glycoside hydrolase family 16 protein [Dactylosporangium sp. AC04546]
MYPSVPARLTTLLVVAVTTVFAAPVPARAGDPVGWTPVFSDSFDDAGALPAGCSAYEDGASFRREAVTVSDGRLRLALRRASGGYVTGELRCPGVAQQYGRYEFRARVPVGAGIESTVLLRPVDGAAADHASELSLVAADGQDQAFVSNGDGRGTSTKTLTGKFRDWHVYVIEWAPSGFRVTVDGTERLADPAVSTAQRWFGFAVTTGARAGTPGPSTPLPAEFQVDYLRIWAFTPVSSAPPPTASPSIVDGSLRPPGGPTHRWSMWLAVAAAAMVGVALVALVIHKTRPHRPPSSHRR